MKQRLDPTAARELQCRHHHRRDLTLNGTSFPPDVEVLERLATPEARQALQSLAEGAPGALPTRHARAALDRLAR